MGSGLGSVIGAVTGGTAAANAAAGAAGGAALAQQAEAQRQQAYVKQQGDLAIQDLSNPRDIAAYEKSLSAQERNVQRSESLAASIDPALIEAGSQALKLLQGQDASTLAPVRAERQRQRTELINQLREQLGPGAETSSAGLQALQRFDADTTSAVSNAQQQSLGQLLNASLSARPDLNSANTTLASLSQQRGTSLANARLGFTGQYQQAGQAVTGAAGAQYAGALVRAQGQQANANMVGQIGGSALGGWLGGMGGGAASKLVPGGNTLSQLNLTPGSMAA